MEIGRLHHRGSCFAAWWWLASVWTDLRREPRRGSLLGGGWPRWVQIWENSRGSFRNTTPWVSQTLAKQTHIHIHAVGLTPEHHAVGLTDTCQTNPYSYSRRGSLQNTTQAQPPRRRFQPKPKPNPFLASAENEERRDLGLLQSKTKSTERRESTEWRERKNQFEMSFGKNLKYLYSVVPSSFFNRV